MDRKQQLEQLINLNKQAVNQTQTNISSLQDELEEIKKQEKKPVSRKLSQLVEQFKKNPKDEDLRKKVTAAALEANQGHFAVWRGGLTNGPDAQHIEISQPAFNSENRLIDPPVVVQSFEAVYVDSLEDLKNLLPLNPTGLLSLPTQAFFPFREYAHETSGDPSIEVVHQPLYDTGTVSTNGTAQLNFFQVPLGGTSAGAVMPKTQIQTNMDQGGSLPYPKHFKITGISVYPDASTPYDDVIRLMGTAWVRIFIGTRDYLVLPLSAVAVGSSQRNPLISFRLSNPCVPVYHFAEPIDLIPQQNFRVEINFPIPQEFSQAFDIKVILHGSFARRGTHITGWPPKHTTSKACCECARENPYLTEPPDNPFLGGFVPEPL